MDTTVYLFSYDTPDELMDKYFMLTSHMEIAVGQFLIHSYETNIYMNNTGYLLEFVVWK